MNKETKLAKGAQKISVKKRVAHKEKKTEKVLTKPIIALLIVAAAILSFNQFQISNVLAATQSNGIKGGGTGSVDLASVDINTLGTTAQSLAAVFPELSQVSTSDEVMGVLFPTGTPVYGEALGVSFDDPITSLKKLSEMYRPLKAEVESKDPAAFQRFVNLASNPRGISCEYCCGVGPAGADTKGNSLCGCQHNPALLSVTLYLTAYTDYTDAEILREALKWKTLFFPQNMIDLGTKISGGDTGVLKDLPGMVGGC